MKEAKIQLQKILLIMAGVGLGLTASLGAFEISEHPRAWIGGAIGLITIVVLLLACLMVSS